MPFRLATQNVIGTTAPRTKFGAAVVAVARNLAVLLLTLWHDEAHYETDRHAA